MSRPSVSVIIPSYNYAAYIAGCIQSVLDQTFTDFEVIVVDDGSKDNTADVVAQFNDPRVKYIYQENKGLPGARNTGIRNAAGTYLAFLDSDDKYHPRKLEIQLDFLEANPEVGLCYNSRFLVDQNDNVLMLRRAPETVDLADLLLGYPFAPSDVVMRREWADRVGLFDESFKLNSEDLNFHIRLQLAGCRFAGVPQALSYRQIHTGRHFYNIAGKIRTYLRALDTAFEHMNCPPNIMVLRDQAYADHYLTWGYQAAVQEDAVLGKELLQQAVQLAPQLLQNDGAKLIRYFSHASMRDGSDPAPALRHLFAALPHEMDFLRRQREAIIGRAYLLGGTLDMIWDRHERGVARIDCAATHGALVDQSYWHFLNDQIYNFQFEFGPKAARRALQRLGVNLTVMGSKRDVRHFTGAYFFNQAMRNYKAGQFHNVPGQVVQAMVQNPNYLVDSGAFSILFRSLWASIAH